MQSDQHGEYVSTEQTHMQFIERTNTRMNVNNNNPSHPNLSTPEAE
jgi:hypothetical protein